MEAANDSYLLCRVNDLERENAELRSLNLSAETNLKNYMSIAADWSSENARLRRIIKAMGGSLNEMAEKTRADVNGSQIQIEHDPTY